MPLPSKAAWGRALAGGGGRAGRTGGGGIGSTTAGAVTPDSLHTSARGVRLDIFYIFGLLLHESAITSLSFRLREVPFYILLQNLRPLKLCTLFAFKPHSNNLQI